MSKKRKTPPPPRDIATARMSPEQREVLHALAARLNMPFAEVVRQPNAWIVEQLKAAARDEREGIAQAERGLALADLFNLLHEDHPTAKTLGEIVTAAGVDLDLFPIDAFSPTDLELQRMREAVVIARAVHAARVAPPDWDGRTIGPMVVRYITELCDADDAQCERLLARWGKQASAISACAIRQCVAHGELPASLQPTDTAIEHVARVSQRALHCLTTDGVEWAARALAVTFYDGLMRTVEETLATREVG